MNFKIYTIYHFRYLISLLVAQSCNNYWAAWALAIKWTTWSVNCLLEFSWNLFVVYFINCFAAVGHCLSGLPYTQTFPVRPEPMGNNGTVVAETHIAWQASNVPEAGYRLFLCPARLKAWIEHYISLLSLRNQLATPTELCQLVSCSSTPAQLTAGLGTKWNY